MPDSKHNNRIVRKCSFCERTEDEVNFLIPNQSGSAYICDDCLEAGHEIVQEAIRAADAGKDRKAVAEIRKGLKKPKVTRSYSKFKKGTVRKMVLDRNIIEQELKKKYKNARFIDADVYISDVNGGYYIYARMVRD